MENGGVRMGTTDDRRRAFIEKATEVHKGEGLDYSKVVYVNNRTPVVIIDPEYGEFSQTPSNHLKGQGHPMRRSSKISSSKACDFYELVGRFNKVHEGEDLDYSKSVYVNMHTPILIIDHDKDAEGSEYGEYWQEPSAHLKGSRHPRKAVDRRNNGLSDQLDIIGKFKEAHGDRYDYSLVEYGGYRSKVRIVCPKHGEFEQSVENHIAGKGCPSCGHINSSAEDELYGYITSLGVECVRNDRSILNGKEIDLYCPSANVGFEYDGLRWHTEWGFGKGRGYHLSKTEKCAEAGVRLIHVFEDEYLTKKEIVLSKIRRILGKDSGKKSVYARNCVVRTIPKSDAWTFLDENHIQGHANSSVYYGAFDLDGALCGVMGFKLCEGEWELNRFATDIKRNCVGVGGKLFKAFVADKQPTEVKSFADRRWSVDCVSNLYRRLGFELDGIVGPDYSYVKLDDILRGRMHKFGFRKRSISKKYGFPSTMTEGEMMKSLGYDRVWNCGLLKYVWRMYDKPTP